MPRRSSGGGYRARPAPARPAPARARSPPPPQTVKHAPPPATAQPQRSAIGSTIADGMTWGAGNAIGHRVVDAIMGPRTIKHETVVSEAAPASPVANSMASASCDTQSKAFQECVNNYGSDISKCQFYMDMLTECKKNSGSMMAA
ncbi:hypothetical protein HID58_089512 [Brassica napus]|uniref:CHCH domain-containing protein n=1 Tax=Brassica napus TaxID=3708 RepID=A0ABQ7Y1Z0_BRANA|nr:uncharacterized protein C6C3.02c [Brassica napus]KAH0861251.1 hypothetical protein HID58_089512 [Brassica napus]